MIEKKENLNYNGENILIKQCLNSNLLKKMAI